MTSSRGLRSIVPALGLILLAGCANAPIQADAARVNAYSPDREAALYPEGPPFLAVYEKAGATLGWVAAIHVNDPATPTGDVIRAAFARLDPDALILEGFATSLGPDPERIIAAALAMPPDQGSETEIAIREAAAGTVTVRGGEPTTAELGRALVAQGFTPQDVVFSMLFGPLDQDRREGVFADTAGAAFDASFRAQLDWLGDLPAELGLAYPTPAAFRLWFAERFGTALADDPDWYRRGWPGDPGLGGQIARASNLQRDRHLYALTVEMLNRYDTVIVVYGGSHLSSVWDALAFSMGKPEILRAKDL